MAVQLPPNSTGSVVDTVQPTAGKERQIASLGDPLVGTAQATVAQFHNVDNQAPGGTAYGLLTGGVAQLLNVSGNIDRQRETGQDGIAAVGVATGSAQFAMQFLTTDTTDTFTAGTHTFTPVAMSGTVNGVAWSIVAGSVLTLDTGASAEVVLVTAVAATTFTCVTTKTHTATFNVAGFVYNQERDAAGEQDGASGSGTAVAAEYEFNGGGPITNVPAISNLQYDRARNLQGKNLIAGSISNNPLAAGSTTLTLNSAPTTLQSGGQILLDRAGANPEAAYVAKNYTVGSATVPLQSATQFSHAQNSTVEWDVFGPLGPSLNGFTAVGIGIEEEAVFNPVDSKYYIERSATQDAMPAANVVAECLALWNGATMDRGKSASATNMSAATTGVGVHLTALPGQWSVFSTPNAATQATASQAAGGAGVRHVCTSISATLAAGATAQAAAAIVNLRDGATGAGTIKWSKQAILPVNGLWEVSISGLAIVGSAATAMTLEFSAAGAAATFESVAMTGYDVT